MIHLGPFWSASEERKIIKEELGETANDIIARLGAGKVEVVSPISECGDVELLAGDSYTVADGRALSWHSDTWPDLSGAVIRFIARSNYNNAESIRTICAYNPTTKTITCELTTEQTASIPPGQHKFFISAVQADGDTLTLAKGELMVFPSFGGNS